VAAFEENLVVHTGDDVPSTDYTELLTKLPSIKGVLSDLEVSETPAEVASALEFILEGLHLSKRLNKDAVGGKATYSGRSR
jgi:magnesium chelatase subunit I